MRKALKDLKRRLAEVSDLQSVGNLLEWDECVFMPPQALQARLRQKALLAKLAHRKFTSASIGRLLDKLLPLTEDLPYESDEASLVRVTKREYDRAIRVPSDFVTRLEEHKSRCSYAWGKAREENDFSVVAPCLKTGIELSREYAGFFPGYKHVADPLIENNDYGMDVSTVTSIFGKLRTGLRPLFKVIASRPEPDDSFLYLHYPKKKQLYCGQKLIQRLGFDFSRGRQDLSRHPFTINMSLDDVRTTTHISHFSFFDSFSSTLHEAGHAMYLQGISTAYEGSPLANGASIGVHEGQARLWENLVGRSRHFWSYFFPVLQGLFPDQLQGISLDNFYQGINKVRPSINRTEADEVTYNLHVMIRFDLELDLLEGRVEVDDLPEAWNERYESELNVSPSNYSEGVLQDVHWYCDLFGGGFQSYAIGNIISAICYDCATRSHPEIFDEMKNGEFGTLFNWLTDNIYKHGSKFATSELVQSLTGSPLPVEPYLKYLYGKYASLYELNEIDAVPARPAVTPHDTATLPATL